MAPIVSIGLPVFNGERFLDEVVESILGQTFAELELIISDNGSTDNSRSIAESWRAKDPRVRIYCSEVNLGAAPNFNKTVALSQGKYFKWAACDDLLDKHFIARCVEILETRKDLSSTEKRSKLESLLQEFNIEHIRQNKGMSLSGGERRRTEIARTLATDPKFILLDEPFAGVDPISVSDIKQIIQHLKSRDIGILLTDHNVRETLDICEKAYIVSEGQIIAKGDAEAILNNEKGKKATRLTGAECQLPTVCITEFESAKQAGCNL